MKNPSQTMTHLEQLVGECRAAQRGFEQAASRESDERLRTVLANYSALRGQLAAELDRTLSEVGNRPQSTAVPAPHTRPEAYAPPGAVGSQLLDSCCQQEQETLRHYQWVLKRELPAAVRQVVSRQFAALQADSQRLGELQRERTSEPSSHSSAQP